VLSLSAIYRLGHRKCPFVFLFVRASAFEVPNVDKQGACSTHRAEYRNSNLWCSMVHRFPSVTSNNLSHKHICFIYWLWWGPLRGWSSAVASIICAFMLGIHLRFFHCFSSYSCCYTLMSPLLISVAKHKIWYSYVVDLQPYSPLTRPHAHKKTNNCSYAFRGYEMAKPFLWWLHVNNTCEFRELSEVTSP